MKVASRVRVAVHQKVYSLFSNLSRQPVLQKPTTWPLYVVRDPSSIGLPDQGQFSFIAFLMFKSFGLVIAFASSCKT